MSLFSQDFQAGGHFEVFSAQGSQPLLNWKATANNVKKVRLRNDYNSGIKIECYFQICADVEHGTRVLTREYSYCSTIDN